jgi:hypothetical protein
MNLRQILFSDTQGIRRAGATSSPGLLCIYASTMCGTVQSQCKALYGSGAYESGFPLNAISKQISASSNVAAIA